MNCKPGDLAVIVSGGNLGRMVQVMDKSTYGDGWWFIEMLGGDGSGYFAGMPTRLKTGNIKDYRLKPLRDTPGEDETLQWAPVPGERVRV